MIGVDIDIRTARVIHLVWTSKLYAFDSRWDSIVLRRRSSVGTDCRGNRRTEVCIYTWTERIVPNHQLIYWLTDNMGPRSPSRTRFRSDTERECQRKSSLCAHTHTHTHTHTRARARTHVRRAQWKNRISSTSMKLRKSLVKPVTRQNTVYRARLSTIQITTECNAAKAYNWHIAHYGPVMNI